MSATSAVRREIHHQRVVPLRVIEKEFGKARARDVHADVDEMVSEALRNAVKLAHGTSVPLLKQALRATLLN